MAGLALIICMFLPWYGLGFGGDTANVGLPEVPGIDTGSIELNVPEVDDDASGWDSLTDFDGFLIAAAGLSGIGLWLLAAAGRRLNVGGLRRGSITAILGVLAVALIVWRLFAQPTPGADLKYGIFLGLAAAIGLAAGAIMALREEGFEPLAAVPGRRTKAVSGSGSTTARRSTAAKRSSSASSGSKRKSSGSSGSKSGGRSSSGAKRK